MSLEDQREILITYLNMKVSQNDWHAVSDAANDLREVELKLRMIEDDLQND